MDAAFRVDALAEAMAQCGQPEIFNTDQGSQFASFDFTDVLKDAGVAISIDGRGRYIDNIFIERLWRSLKYKAVCLHELTDGLKAERVIPRVVNNHSFDGPRWLSGQARRGPRDAVPSDKRRQLPGKPPRATAGRSAQQGSTSRRWMRRPPILGPLDVGSHDGAPRSYPATKSGRSNGSLSTTHGIIGDDLR